MSNTESEPLKSLKLIVKAVCENGERVSPGFRETDEEAQKLQLAKLLEMPREQLKWWLVEISPTLINFCGVSKTTIESALEI